MIQSKIKRQSIVTIACNLLTFVSYIGSISCSFADG